MRLFVISNHIRLKDSYKGYKYQDISGASGGASGPCFVLLVIGSAVMEGVCQTILVSMPVLLSFDISCSVIDRFILKFIVLPSNYLINVNCRLITVPPACRRYMYTPLDRFIALKGT